MNIMVLAFASGMFVTEGLFNIYAEVTGKRHQIGLALLGAAIAIWGFIF